MLRALLLATVAACSDSSSRPTGPTETRSLPEILDGSRQGNPHFFFLPPLVPAPVVTGTVDPTAFPIVVVCEWDTSVPGGQCGPIVAQFARESNIVDPSGADVPGQIRFTGESYHVRWDTQQCLDGPCQLSSTRTYRLRVLIGSTELGHADVSVVPNQSAIKNVNTNDYISLIDGRKLQLKFRIEIGAVTVVQPGQPAVIGTAGGDITTADGEVSLHVPNGAVAAATPITIMPITETRPQTGAWSDPVELGPDGTQFAQPVTLTLSYDVTKLPEGVTPEALRLMTWVNDHWEEVPGSTLNLDDATISAPISHFSGYSLGIWPNATQGAPGTQQLYVGQTQTFGGSVWYYQTYPYQQCYTRRVRVGGFFGRWVYVTECQTYTGSYSYPISGGYVRWGSSDPTIASVAAPGYSITDVNGRTTSPPVTALRTGFTVITEQVGAQSVGAGLTVLPKLVFDVAASGQNPVRLFGFNQAAILTIRIPSPRTDPLTVTLTHKNPLVGASNPTVTIPAGFTQQNVGIRALTTAGTDTLIGTGPGYGPDTLIIIADRGNMSVGGWPSSLNYGDSAAIRIHPLNQDGSIIDNAYFTTFALGSTDGIAFSRNNAPITSITVPDGSSSTPVFYVKGISSGPATMTVSNQWYNTGTFDVTVGAPPVVSILVQPDPVNVRPGQTVQLTASAFNSANGPVSGIPFTWASSNTSIATVTTDGRVIGVATGIVTITASNGSVQGTATVHVGIPGISASPTALTLPVQQGQTRTATININNAGTGLLTGLQASPFFNYFNGSPATWVTASFNTTTAPAVLTITASPDANVGPGVHQLTFTVYGNEGTSHTFNSINITVIAQGVTPVNATINPTPTSLFFNVEQGTSASRTITINNGGTDPLTNLSTGSFSNYFNGSPAPWVTATLNTTTAPATITVTATPGMSIPAEEHHLRFDVMSPGATNSPYTFYSIRVNVTPSTVPQFTLTDLGTLGGAGSSEALAINSSGRIVGQSNNQGFYMNASATSLTQIPNHVGDIWTGWDVNDAGIVAWSNPYLGFLWDPATNTRQGPPPGPFQQNNRTTVFGVNNTGRVFACVDNGAFAQNYIWTIATNTVTLIPNAYNVCSGAINDAGVAVANADPGAGGNSRLWNDVTQVATPIPSLDGVTIGWGINSSSVAVGSSQVGGLRRAFRFDPADGTTQNLGTLGGNESAARGINDAGVIVGWSRNAAGLQRGFIWVPAQQRMYELAPLPGYTESTAIAINASGVIVGWSTVGGVNRATRWTPQ